MKHATSRMLHAHWDALRGARSAPERGEIEPGEIRHILADSFLLEIDAPTRVAHVRLAGTRVCALFGRELRGESFTTLWGAGRTADPWRLVETVIEETAGVVAGLRGTTDREEPVDLEMLLLPLRHRGKTQVRAIGSLGASALPSWVGARPVVGLETLSLRILVPDARPSAHEDAPPELAPSQVRRHGFVVHQGGLA